jgi:ribonuclease HI
VQPGDQAWLEAEILKNLQRGSWHGLDAVPEFCAPAFIVANAAGKRRVVIDLRHVNEHLVRTGARYDGLTKLRDLIPPDSESWLISCDLESGYHHVGIAPEHQRFLGFEIDGRFFLCAALPFGLSDAPRVFTKVMRAVVAHLRGAGTRCLAYLDDFLFVFPSQGAAAQGAVDIDALLRRLGLSRNLDKGCWAPTQVLRHLGSIIDTTTMRFLPDPERVARIRNFAAELGHLAARRTRCVPRVLVQKFAGLAVSTTLSVPLARLQLRAIFDCVAAARGNHSVRLSSAALTELRWWRDDGWDGGNHIMLPRPNLTLETDASDIGWGAVVKSQPPAEARGYFTPAELETSINVRELLAVLRALQAHGATIAHRDVRLHIDNQAAAFGLINMTMRSAAARAVLLQIWRIAQRLGVRFLVRWIPTWANRDADRLSRFRDRSDYKLAPELVQQCWRRWGSPTVDAFASARNKQCRRFWAAFPQPGAEKVDALAQSWAGEHIWANPPWQLVPPLLRKLADEPDAELTLVLPYWRAAAWFPEVLRRADDWILWAPRDGMFLPGFEGGNEVASPAPHWAVWAVHIPRRR